MEVIELTNSVVFNYFATPMLYISLILAVPFAIISLMRN